MTPATFAADGVLVVRRLVDDVTVEHLRTLIDEVLAAPGPTARDVTRGEPGRFESETFLWDRFPELLDLLRQSSLPAIIRAALGSTDLNLFFDQLMVKEPATPALTRWHQDLPYWPLKGTNACSAWLALDPVTEESGAVRYVRGSHRWGRLYQAAPIAGATRQLDHLEVVPDIDAEPGRYDTVSYRLQPGDCVVHHSLLIHGAYGNRHPTRRRRAYITRWVGDGVHYDPRPATQPLLRDPELRPGDRLSGLLFPSFSRNPDNRGIAKKRRLRRRMTMNGNCAAVDQICGRVSKALAEFIDGQREILGLVDEVLLAATDSIVDLLAGGKRLRSAFCYWGWRGAGREECQEIIAASAALELLHASALIHDDVMDASDMRRFRPTVHRQFEGRHAMADWHGSAEEFGLAVAILLGDLLLCWSDEMLHSSGLTARELSSGRKVLDKMRTELVAGQYLDLVNQVTGSRTVSGSLKVAGLKSGKYTVERPLQLGAALAGVTATGETCGDTLPVVYSAYGLPLGLAFQIRDDILGVFGDSARTGKPVGDDVREGKSTVLLAVARSRATASQAAIINHHLGDRSLEHAQVEQIQQVIIDTGALAACERMINRQVDRAVSALASALIPPPVRQALTELASFAAMREA
jgi:geranylgeranyl diphosphate synthase type I